MNISQTCSLKHGWHTDNVQHWWKLVLGMLGYLVIIYSAITVHDHRQYCLFLKMSAFQFIGCESSVCNHISQMWLSNGSKSYVLPKSNNVPAKYVWIWTSQCHERVVSCVPLDTQQVINSESLQSFREWVFFQVINTSDNQTYNNWAKHKSFPNK